MQMNKEDVKHRYNNQPITKPVKSGYNPSSELIERQTQEFLARGGRIEQVPTRGWDHWPSMRDNDHGLK